MNALPSDPPADVVPPSSGPTADTYRRMSALVGRPVRAEFPGEVVCDVDGVPAGVGPSRRVDATMARPIVTRDQLERVGLTPEQVPNLYVIDVPDTE